MANKIKYEGKQTSPDTYGQEFKKKYENGVPSRDSSVKDDDDKAKNEAMLEIWRVGSSRNKSQWSEEDFQKAVNEYFEFIAENGIKPSKVGLALWLGCDKSTYHLWSTQKEKYGFKFNILASANSWIEMTYIDRGEKYPTFNTFLLKTSHGHIEQSKLDITTNGNDVNSVEEVKDLVAKLGLDKK